jgi:hypothetical protein
MKNILILTALIVYSTADASVWEATEQWNASWELQYSAWVKNQFNSNFFVEGKWAGTPTDCADAVYFARLIFAYENHLPFAMKDPTGGGGLISNKMARFDGVVDEAKRLKTFMSYIEEMGSTETIPGDTYPVQIDRENVRPGSVWSRVRITAGNWWQKLIGRGAVEGVAGHAEIVKEIKETGAIYLMGSTVPPKVRSLLLTSSFVFLPTDSSTGLRNWIWPQSYATPRKDLPGYSREQFSIGEGRNGRNIDSWSQEVQKRLSSRNETKSEVLERISQDLCSLSRARIEIVSEGALYSKKIGRCMNREEYESWSSPTRDLRIKISLLQLVREADLGETLSSSVVDKLPPFLDQCPALQITPDRRLELRDYLRRVSENRTSSNPNDSVESRWGLADSRGSHCSTYD